MNQNSKTNMTSLKAGWCSWQPNHKVSDRNPAPHRCHFVKLQRTVCWGGVAPTKRLLCLSNGHGEDVIAVSVLKRLKEIAHFGRWRLEVEAIPLVGLGHAYQHSSISTIGPSKNMPSGGFISMNALCLLRDAQAGLLSLAVSQWKTIETWVIENPDGILLAVGDVFPLFLAWMASRQPRNFQRGFNTRNGVKYIFIGTAKSEYHRWDDNGVLHKHEFLDLLVYRLFPGSVYFPWERAMMVDTNCRLVVPRDSFTVETLKKSLPVSARSKVKDLGNPMMDDLKPLGKLDFLKKLMPALCVALLPGSRTPEVYFNWQTILSAIENLLRTPLSDHTIFLAPIVPSLELGSFSKMLLNMGWQYAASERILHNAESVLCLRNIVTKNNSTSGKSDILYLWCYEKDNALLLLLKGLFPDVASWADAGVAMAGTATEQLVGLGKPVFTLAGNGPQFTYAFAAAQSRLLGKSVTLCSSGSIASEMAKVLSDKVCLNVIKQNGQKRMGASGAAWRIAEEIHNLVLQ